MSVVVLDTKIVHYEALGRGRPVIFLHGWVGSWRYWIPVMQLVSTQYRTYALDLWGFGDTTKDKDRYSLNEQVKLLDGFLYQMGIGRVVLVGHGLGGIVAGLYAMRNVDIVDRQVIVSLPGAGEALNNRLASGAPQELADWLLGKGEKAEPARADAAKTDPLTVQESLRQHTELKVYDIWKQTDTPSLFIHGQNDLMVSLPAGEQLDNLPEKSHAMVFEQSGHFPMLDEENKFGRLLMDFLALKSGESPRQLQLKEEWKRRIR
jgi:pimeloyl-ACP methyl ester carboxylesterase